MVLSGKMTAHAGVGGRGGGAPPRPCGGLSPGLVGIRNLGPRSCDLPSMGIRSGDNSRMDQESPGVSETFPVRPVAHSEAPVGVVRRRGAEHAIATVPGVN